MKKILLLLFTFFLSAAYAQQRPNIIYIMSDDHDADAISAYNRKFISTPNIDRIAKEGMRFTNCFVAILYAARCGLLSSQVSIRIRME